MPPKWRDIGRIQPPSRVGDGRRQRGKTLDAGARLKARTRLWRLQKHLERQGEQPAEWLEKLKSPEWLAKLAGPEGPELRESLNWLMEIDQREMRKDRQSLEWLEKLKSPEGLVWLANPEGQALRKSLNWLDKHENLERQRGQPPEWLEKLKSLEGLAKLAGPEGPELRGSINWIMDLEWHEMHKGRQPPAWLEKLKSPEGLVWLANPEGQILRENLDWLHMLEHHEMQEGRHPEEWLEKLKSLEGLAWLATPAGLAWREGHNGAINAELQRRSSYEAHSKFVKRVGDLSSGWQSSEVAIKQELGENVYEGGSSILAAKNQEYASREMSLDQAKQIAKDSDVIRSMEHTLEYAKRRSELRDQASETFKTIQEVRQYLESHQEEMPRKLREDIEFPLNMISTKYFDERIEFSSPSLTRTMRKTQLSPEGEELLRPTKEILPHESLSVTSGEHLLEMLEDDLQQHECLSQIKERILEHEKKELPKFVKRVRELSANWQSSETAIARVFGKDSYEDGKSILASIIDKNHFSKEMNLKLTKEIKDDNASVRSIEVKLEYIKHRAEIPWLETPEEPEHDRGRATEIVTSFPYLQSDQVLTMFNRARSLDKWVRGNDPRVTPDIIEKIGQSLAQTNRTLALAEATEKGNHQSLGQLTRIIALWDEYREKNGAQPPIYPRDLPLEYRRNKYIYLIDPSKITIGTRKDIGYRYTYVQEEMLTRENEAKMVEDASKRLKTLLNKMKKKFASFLKDNNIFPDELWRLGIDERFQGDDPISSVGNMNEVKRDNPEPYFLLGTMQGLAFTFARIGRKLTPEYYQALHYECMKDNKVLRERRVIASHVHGFRYIDFEYDDSARLCFHRLEMRVKRTASGLKEAHQNYNHRYKGDPRYKDQGHPLGRVLTYEDPYIQPNEIPYVPFTEEECKANTQCIFDKYDEEIEQARRKIANRHRQKKWHKNLAKNLSEKEIEELLTPIANCCRELELSHFFRDGNARAASFCILTKLLIENGLPPAIMPHNPWKVLEDDGIEEIVAALRKGIAKGQTVLKRR